MASQSPTACGPGSGGAASSGAAAEDGGGPRALEVDVAVESSPVVNLAMHENSVAFVRRISVTSRANRPLRDLTVEAGLGARFGDTWSAVIAELDPGATYHFDEPDVPLDRDQLVSLAEAERAELRVEVRAEAAAVEAGLAPARWAGPVRVLAYNEWYRGGIPQLLAAFVMPNHPAVMTILAAARGHLERLTGDPAMNGYQARDPARTLALIQAVYQAVQEHGITYASPPASFEEGSQKVRTPEQVLGDRLGTCIDLSVFLASCFEQAGLNPLVFVVRGHAFPGVWLNEEDLAVGATDDCVLFRKLVQLRRLVVFDSSAVAARPLVSLEQAMREAMGYLEAPDDFVYAVDIHGARHQRYLPLPLRLTGVHQPADAPVVDRRPPAGTTEPGARETRGGAPARTRFERVERWKQRLLDTSLRNRLINFRDTKQSVRLYCPSLARLEDRLASGAELRLLPPPSLFADGDPRSKRRLEKLLDEDVVTAFLRDRLEQDELYAEPGSDDLGVRLTGIYRTARESLQETGTNTLCLALGFLAWYESDASEVRRLAPLLLVPVTLRRNARSSSFSLQSSDDETRLNVTLLEKLKHDTGITLPELAELPLDDAGVDVPFVLHAVRNAVLNLRRWEVIEDLYLGHFSFAKFLMWADLDQRAEALLESPVVHHLTLGAGQPYPDQGPFPEPARIDQELAPADLLCPLDSDSSQTAAVLAAAAGKTFVLQGPPGTGKSQTITNLIAHGLAEGKRVLFVAEKMAALDVVHRRLGQIGLGAYCLELHSHKAGKKQLLAELERALKAAPPEDPADWARTTAQLAGERDRLNDYAEALHRPREIGASVFQVLSRLMSLREAPRLDLDASRYPDRDEHAVAREAFVRYQAAASALPSLATIAWRGCAVPAWRLSLPEEVEAGMGRATRALTAARAATEELADALALSAPGSPDEARAHAALAAVLLEAPDAAAGLAAPMDWPSVETESRALIHLGTEHATARAALLERYREALFELELPALVERFGRYAGAFFLIAWWMLRQARKVVRATRKDGRLPSSRQVLADLERALAARAQERELDERRARVRALFGGDGPATTQGWDDLGGKVDWAARFDAAVRPVLEAQAPEVRAAVRAQLAALPQRWAQEGIDVGALHLRAAAALDEVDAGFSDLEGLLGWDRRAIQAGGGDAWTRLAEQLERWRSDLPLLRDWCFHVEAARQVRALGGEAVVAAVDAGELACELISRAFDRSFYQSWLSLVTAQEPALATFLGRVQLERIERFAALDRAYLGQSQQRAAARVGARAPREGAAAARGSELSVLHRELAKKRRHKPIRQLFQEIPTLLGRLKPCLLMSPMSVAQYLDPAGDAFDLVVFDEASQIPTHDAIGALARGRSAVIVGDSKQLPPTSFFQTAEGELDDEDELEELESILDECVAAGLPQRQLDWHYRSRHESLIAFSNYHYYDNRLNTFPAAVDRATGRSGGLGVSLRRIDGTYDKGKTRQNLPEARAVVDEVVHRLRAPEQPRRSIGIVTFSKAQQTLIEDLLDEARRRYPEIEPHFDDAGGDEPVIVKNLENIQGDERDVMLFSICYGPDAAGRVAMNFGPLNRDGGERRLNVAITRARQELIVFSTLLAEHIDLTRTGAVGVKHLKTFLEYAERGPAAIAEATAVRGDAGDASAFEREVHALLTARGWQVDAQVGCAGYRVDLGVRDPATPGRYLLGIECDGAYYRAARTARDRDRLRAQVLAGLGWNLYRLWSTDWWLDRDAELVRLEAHLHELARAAHTGAPAEPAAAPVDADRDADADPAAPEVTAGSAAPVVAVVPPDAAAAPDTAPPTAAGRPYVVAEVPAGRRGPDDLYAAECLDELRDLARGVVEVEAPLTVRLLARRVAPYFGLQRTSRKMEDRLRAVLADSVQLADDVLWRRDQDPSTFTAYRVPGADDKRDAPDIPPTEIMNAALVVLRTNVALPEADLIRETARLFGFSRTGDRVAKQMTTGITLLLQRGSAQRDGDRILLA